MQIIVVLLLFPLLVLALVVRIFLFQPFNSPSMSMAPTLVVGDRYFVAKYAYGYSRYSFPLNIKLLSGRAFAQSPEYGDIVVFRLPNDVRADYIKRVVGLPGDRIQMKAGRLFINGQAVRRAADARSRRCGRLWWRVRAGEALVRVASQPRELLDA
jgi:signal peptidase I